MTVALKGSLSWESVVVRVSSRRMRRARSWGMVRDGAAARMGRVRRRRRRMQVYLEREETWFNGDLSCFGVDVVIVSHVWRQVNRVCGWDTRHAPGAEAPLFFAIWEAQG